MNPREQVPPGRLTPTWIENGGQTYGAQPDLAGPIGGGPGYADLVVRGDHYVAAIDELLAVLARVKEGQIILVDPAAAFDFTDRVLTGRPFALRIPPGVTVAGGRGARGADGEPPAEGALFVSDEFRTQPLIEVAGPGVRITGLRLRGPDPKRRLEFHHRVFRAGQGGHAAYYRFPTSTAVRCAVRGAEAEADPGGVEIDNCEISGWSRAGVFLIDGSGHHVHHCFIHHCQRMGLGYGVCLNAAAATIDHNIFQDNKHDIAGTGRPGTSYEAAHNVVRPPTESHVWEGQPYGQDHAFDMHGGEDRGDGTMIAGTELHIHHNSFLSTYPAVVISGVPEREAVIERNWLCHASEGDAFRVRTRVAIRDNVYGRLPGPGQE